MEFHLVRYQCPHCGARCVISVREGGKPIRLGPDELIECYACEASYRAIATNPGGLWETLSDGEQREIRKKWAKLKSWSRLHEEDDVVPTSTIHRKILEALNDLKNREQISRPVDVLLYYAMVEKPSDGRSELLDTVICVLLEQSAVLRLWRDLKHHSCDEPAQTLFEVNRGLVDRKSREVWAHENMVRFGFLNSGGVRRRAR